MSKFVINFQINSYNVRSLNKNCHGGLLVFCCNFVKSSNIFLVFLCYSVKDNMLMFCPTCANVLVVEEGSQCYRFACNTCPYVQNIKRKVTNRQYPKLKEVDDVLGGAAAWENVDSTQETCPKCEHNRAFFMQIQTRSADEPMTTFYKCCNMACGHRWRE